MMDSLIRDRRRLEVELRAATSYSQVREIKAALKEVNDQITRLKNEDRHRHDPNGRRADLEYLAERRRYATTRESRAAITNAEATIRSQAYDMKTNRLRSEMIKAKNRGDNDEFAAMQEHLFVRGNR